MGNPETLSRSDTPDPAYLTAAGGGIAKKKKQQNSKRSKKGHQNSKIIKIQKSSKFKNHQNSKKNYCIKILSFFCGQAPSCILSMDSHLFVFVFVFLFFSYGQPISLFMANFKLHFHSSWDDGTHLLFIEFVCCIFTVVGTRGHDSCLLLRMCCIFTAGCLQGSDPCRRADSVT